MRRKIATSAGGILSIVAIVVSAGGCFISQPTLRSNRLSLLTVDAGRLRTHVIVLSETLHPRDWEHTSNLDRCAEYIAMHFRHAGAHVESQVFDVQGKQFRNVIGRFGAGQGSKTVIGAHYDGYGDTPGADDNASGIAALIELAYLLGRSAPPREVELVAYVLEEPPFFRTPFMGSAVQAERLSAEKAKPAGVIVLEMVGYFTDERNSQSYPSPLLRLLYPGRGNFIAVVGRWDQGDWVKAVKVAMKGTTDLPVYSIRAPAILRGVDFSDHLNYWPYGIQALMITDTAFYRNPAYHSSHDTADRLDYRRMSKVVVAVFEAVRSL